MNVIRTRRSRRLLAAAAVVAALVAIPAGASARKFEANLRQYGTGTTFDLGCQDGKKPTCAFTIGGDLHGTLVEGTFFGLAIANMAQPVSNNAGGWCYPVEVPMALNTPVPDGDAVFQKIKGMLCDYGAPGGARAISGKFFFDGGRGVWENAAGQGGGSAFIRIEADGTLSFEEGGRTTL